MTVCLLEDRPSEGVEQFYQMLCMGSFSMMTVKSCFGQLRTLDYGKQSHRHKKIGSVVKNEFFLSLTFVKLA